MGPGLGGPVGGGPGGWGVVGGSLGIAALEGCQCVRHQGGDPDTFANGRGGRLPVDFFAVSRSLGRLPWVFSGSGPSLLPARGVGAPIWGFWGAPLSP